MKKPDKRHSEKHGLHSDVIWGIDPNIVLRLILKNWYVFIFSIAVAIYGARFYISHTMQVFRTSTTVLINEGDDRSLVNNDDLLRGLGLPAGMRNIDNQIMILRSRELTERTLREVPFDIEYYYRTVRNQIPFYPNAPARVIGEGDIPLPRNIEFSIKHLGDDNFLIKSESEYFPFIRQAIFGESIETPGGNFRVICMNEEWFRQNPDKDLNFVIHNRINLIRHYNNRLNVDLLSRSGSILIISLTGTNSTRDAEFLNKLTEVFQSMSLERKNYEANRRIQFIDDQLVGISDSLILTETRLQQFRSANRVMDLSAQGQAIISQVMLLENERARLDLEANYYDYLADYLSKDITGELPIIPITMGIDDPALAGLVSTLADLQGQLSSRQAGEMNPLQGLLAQRVRNTKDALRETLNGLRRANSLAVAENEKQIARINTQASSLPATERQLLGFERKFRLNDELYTFLLQMRSEQLMQKASNMADSEVIDPANEQYSVVVAPSPPKIYFIGLFAGAGVPFAFLFLFFVFNKKLRSEDIERITNVPVAGYIPRNTHKINTIVFDNPSSTIAEGFRLLRSRMQFFTKEAVSPVILVTSSMPGDGKTFTSINLASVYSLLGKMTVLVGFDLRKPRLAEEFNLKNEAGVSTWLIGRDKLETIIQPTAHDNLHVITSGPPPPNPSELIALEKTRELINMLKQRYEYIILDTSPIGIVSDTYDLAAMADACILVVRPARTLRDLFGFTLREIGLSEIRGVCMVVNDLKSDKSGYGYGEKYGYTNDKRRKKGFKTFRSKMFRKKSSVSQQSQVK